MEQLKSYGNVNMLDLTHATEEAVSGIQHINNLNLVLVSPETTRLASRLTVGNLNLILEIPDDAHVITRIGTEWITPAFFKTLEKRVYLIATGELMIEPGVSAEDVQKGLAGLAVTGEFFCPEPLMGVFMDKPNHVVGNSITYPPFANCFTGSLTLDLPFLNSLADGTDLCVFREITLPEALPDDLLDRKLGKVFAARGVTCHEENAGTIRAHLYQSRGEMDVIPAGFKWIQKPLTIDSANLDYLPGRQLFCQEQVQISADFDPAAFDQRIDRLIAQDLLVCPAALKATLARKCDLFDTRAIFYTEPLAWVKDEQTWSEARFQALKGAITLLVTGELTIDPAVTPETLEDRLAQVHNFGLIRCTPGQREAIEARLAEQEGQFKTGEPQAEPEPANFIANVNYLKL